jgi:hypothetical protein
VARGALRRLPEHVSTIVADVVMDQVFVNCSVECHHRHLTKQNPRFAVGKVISIAA